MLEVSQSSDRSILGLKTEPKALPDQSHGQTESRQTQILQDLQWFKCTNGLNIPT